MSTISLFLAVAFSAGPDERPPASVFSDDVTDSVVSEFLSAPDAVVVRGQSPGGGWLESLASGWSVEGGVIVLNRQNPKPVPLLRDFGGPVRHTTDQFRFGFEPGWQITARKQLCDLFGAEFRYFRIDDWNATFGSPDTGNGLGVVYDGDMSSIGLGQNVISSLSYTSELENLEANLRLQLTENIVGLVGYRRLEWHDRMIIHQASDAFATTHDIRADNVLDGVQIGGEANLLEWQGLRIGGLVKAGVFHNDASNRFQYIPNPNLNALFGGNLLGDTSTQSDVTSFVGEVGLNASVQVTRNLAVRGGYLCLWIDEIAQASDQPIANPVPVPPPVFAGGPARHVDAGSYQILQGLQFSIELSY